MSENILKDKENYSILLQIYSPLLSDNVRRRMEIFYFEDLSLFEIAENEKVSKNAIFQSIKRGQSELCYYEEKLQVYKKVRGLSKEIDKLKVDDKIKEKIKENYLYGI